MGSRFLRAPGAEWLGTAEAPQGPALGRHCTLYGGDTVAQNPISQSEGKTTVMRFARGFVLACAFTLSAAWAQDLTGKWTATAVSNNVAVTLDLKVAGNVVTGAILNPQSGPAEIRDGKIEGNSISFHVLRAANNATNKILWQGTIAGEEIRFTRSIEGAPGPGMEIIARRAQEHEPTSPRYCRRPA
jgi:hypothetical protein